MAFGKMRMRRGKRTTLRKERGHALVEFVLSVFFVLVVIFWAVELIMLLYTYNVMADAAKEGVRYAIVHGCQSSNGSGTCTPTSADPTGANVVTVVKNYAKASFHDTSAITVNVTYPDSSAKSPSRVQVVVHYAFKPYFTLGWTPPTINAAAQGRIVF
jgi:Flp pilus assembly protein TadG